MSKLYLKINDFRGYDEFYQTLSPKEKTWSEIICHVESCLDDKYIENENQLLGIKMSLEIVDKVPDDVELDD